MRNSLRDVRYRAAISRLVEIREGADITQRDLAERLGRLRSYVSKVETFEHRLDFVQLVDWLRALDLDEKKFLVEMLKDIPATKKRR